MHHLINKHNEEWQLADTQRSDQAQIEWRDAENWQPGQALKLSIDAEIDAQWSQASIIGIDFPALTDGRGLSLAVLLRSRVHYTGDLRGLGAVHEDILHFMVRCGFTSFELPESRDPEVALSCIAPHKQYYQSSVVDPLNQFDRV
jgi:uncharacterized protein (DUF934 family)